MTEFIEVTTTTADQCEAQRIARSLIDSRLAACVQITGPITSVYRWKGELCESSEFRLTIKSLAALTGRIVETIQQQHSYETPEILVGNIADCEESYAQWLRAEVAPDDAQ